MFETTSVVGSPHSNSY